MKKKVFNRKVFKVFNRVSPPKNIANPKNDQLISEWEIFAEMLSN